MFAKIIVDIANSNVDRLFTYSIPNELDVRPGHRVLVPFGRGNKPTEGFVIEVCPEYETDFPVKPLIRTMEPYTCLLEDQLELAKWIQKAYHCTLCDALRLMIPAQLRIEGEGKDGEDCPHSGRARCGSFQGVAFEKGRLPEIPQTA